MPEIITVDRVWSQDQADAIASLQTWYDDCRNGTAPQFLTFGGFAGTGKSTIIAELVKMWSGVAVCALAGKAASVLRSKGVRQASTIHSLIYKPEFDDHDNLLGFVLKDRGELCCSAIIVDEASMVNKTLHDDLLSFDVPVLYVGDHGQLEPIMPYGAEPFNLMHEPDVKLEVIHRQAAGNSILNVATNFRLGKYSRVENMRGQTTNDGKVTVLDNSELYFDLIEGTAICGMNKTRHLVNGYARKSRGFDDGNLLHPGETLICLQNNRKVGVFNGQMFTVDKVVSNNESTTKLVVTDDDGKQRDIRVLNEQFGKDKISKPYFLGETLLMDYGYCLTAHKAQGSEFDVVTVIDEVMGSWDARRWRYTAATRAKERLVYCI